MPIQRIIDSNIIIYSLYENHPAFSDCSKYLQKYDDIDVLYSISDILYEIYHGLTIFYGLEPMDVLDQLHCLLETNLNIENLSIASLEESFKISINNRIDIIDSRLFLLAQKLNAPIIVSDDKRFGKFITSQGLLWETPITNETRKKMDLWEKNNFPTKGLPRVLNNIYHYLLLQDPKIAEKFKKDTNNFMINPSPI